MHQLSQKILVGLFLFFATTISAFGDTTVLLVRHAEKGSQPARNPVLTVAGVHRSEVLAKIAEEFQVEGVFATEFKRTQQTIEPAAELVGIRPSIVGALNINDLADTVLHDYQNSVVLIAGHSNTVPAIIARLGGPQIPDINESEYDNLFILTISPEGTTLKVQKYGDTSL